MPQEAVCWGVKQGPACSVEGQLTPGLGQEWHSMSLEQRVITEGKECLKGWQGTSWGRRNWSEGVPTGQIWDTLDTKMIKYKNELQSTAKNSNLGSYYCIRQLSLNANLGGKFWLGAGFCTEVRFLLTDYLIDAKGRRQTNANYTVEILDNTLKE